MNPIERFVNMLTQALGVAKPPARRPEVQELRDCLSDGKRFKRAEEYDKALERFDRAVHLAEVLKDKTATAIINLQRADIMILKEAWEDAQNLLERLKADAKENNQPIQHAYTLTALGALMQKQGKWEDARTYFEQALEESRKQYSPGAEGRAMGHLADIYMHDGNASYAAHLLEDALPMLESSGDIELSSYFVGRLGEARIENGHDQNGHNLIGRALRLADTMRYVTYQRMWHIILGDRAMLESRYTDANNHYETALRMMEGDTWKSDPRHIRVLRQISRACVQLNKREDALVYAQRAVNYAPDDIESKGVLGVVLRGLGKNDEALPYLEAAQVDDETDILRNLAGAYSDTGEHEKALAVYQRALKIATEHQNSLELARTHRDLGAYYARREDLHNAIKSLETSVELYNQHDFHAQIARLYCDIANLRNRLGQGPRVMKDYENALMRLGQIDDDETRGVVLSNAATAYVEQGDHETAEAFLAESIQIAQKLHDFKAEATRQGNLGWFLLATGRYKRAISALEYALKQSEKFRMPLHVAVQTSNLGLAYGELDDHDLAIKLHRDALDRVHILDAPYWIAVVSLNLATELIKEENFNADEIETLIDEAVQISSEIKNDELDIRVNLIRARLAFKQDALEQAASVVEEAENRARRTHRRRLLGEALLQKSELLAKQDQHDKSVEAWEEAHKIMLLLHHPAAHKTPEWV